VYKGTPSIQLLLQSVFKIALATAISKIQTGTVPKIIFFDKFLIISALLFSCSSFCTFKIWYVYEMSPFVYSMGTTPSLFFVDILQNGWSFHKLSTLTLLAWFIVPGHIVPAFFVKCILASFASYTSSIGLGFAQSGDVQERSSKVVSFSIISALIPLPWISDRGTPKNQLYEYVQAFIGAVSGLMTAFVLSYNGTVAKVGISSVKDFIFLFLQNQYLTVWSVVFMIGKCVVSAVSLRPVLQKSSTTEPENPSKNIIQSV
tara:strand:- start:588 stop:1367 length:780 start_codon:yes stop_codon:yes gene_type:complete